MARREGDSLQVRILVLALKALLSAVRNRTPEKAEPHAKAGARVADSAIGAVRAREAVITCIRIHSDTRKLLGADPMPILTTLAGESSHIGDNARPLAAIYASLFLPRQGFMFGMIYGALICEKAGVSMRDDVEQLPLTIKVVHDYCDVFAKSALTKVLRA